MSSLRDSVLPVLERCQDGLVEVGAIVSGTAVTEIDGQVPLMDRRLRQCYEELEATRRLLTLYRQARPQYYDPAEVLRTAAAQVAEVQRGGGQLTATRRCEGDPEQVVECLQVLLESIELKAGAALRTTVQPGEAQPQILVETAQLPAALSVAGVYTVHWESWTERWRHATEGGDATLGHGQVRLLLEGDGEAGIGIAGLEEAMARLRRVVQRLRSWRGAIGHYEPGFATHAEIQLLYRKTVDAALREMDGLAALV